MKRIFRNILAADDPKVKKAADDYAMKTRTVTDEELDSNTKKLINKYAQDLLIDKGKTAKEIVRENGPDLIEFLSRKEDIDYSDIPAIFNYFSKYNFAVVAATDVEDEWLARHRQLWIDKEVWDDWYDQPILHDEDEWGGRYKTYGEMWEDLGYKCAGCDN